MTTARTASRNIADASPTRGRMRMIHVRLDEETHRRLRVLVATRDSSIQELVSRLILERLDHPPGEIPQGIS